MERKDHEQHQRLFKLKRKSKEEVLEWSPTGYGFIASVPQDNAETGSEDCSWKG
ncbi:hypothetical protein J22TS1_17810 [Siminovitchia terrae]|uniref:hypothetical protein n=1 Tax=Siminovitchia terrae TaxID=1914933 RepID=UPI00163CEBAB|nr:hypothetical protein [Siminovitchia terrae]GIN90730.1 hypothetical protein J22TS1_17810 [Siminovitchia terrae]